MFSTARRFLKFYNEFNHLLNFLLYMRISTEVLIIMSSPGQKRGTCGHIMAVFDGHLKSARCRDKGVGDDSCVLKKDCPICNAFTPEQIQQLATPTYKDRKNKDKKRVSASPTPTLVDPSQVNVLRRVDRKKVAKPETTPTGKKRRSDESPKSSKKKPNSRPSTDDLRSLDDKWAERFARLEAILLSKSFAVPFEPVVKPAEVITSEKPFFNSGAGTSQKSTGVSDVIVTGPSLVQTTEEVPVMKATHPVEAPGMRRGVVIQQNATQPVQAPGAGTATQSVEAPSAGPEVLLTSTGNAALHVERTGGSDSEEDLE